MNRSKSSLRSSVIQHIILMLWHLREFLQDEGSQGSMTEELKCYRNTEYSSLASLCKPIWPNDPVEQTRSLSYTDFVQRSLSSLALINLVIVYSVVSGTMHVRYK